jgi:hypothetical protein
MGTIPVYSLDGPALFIGYKLAAHSPAGSIVILSQVFFYTDLMKILLA